MKVISISAILFLSIASGSLATRAQSSGPHYPAARAPLVKSAFLPLPLGAVKPRGWLRDQLHIQADGLTGHLEEFWPDLGPGTAWKGGEGEGWERGPYYLDGMVPLAILLEDSRLIDKAKPWIEWILASGQPNGWFGPLKNKDRWPLAIAMKVLTQYHEATGDPRVLTLLRNYFKFLADNPPDWPDQEWRGVRAGENVLTAYWLYNRTGDANALKAAQSILGNSFDWAGYFTTFPYRDKITEIGIKPSHPSHVVNIAMAVKYPGLWYMLSNQEKHKQAVYEALRNLDTYHGQVAGRFGGDEHLAGRRPTQGTELCGVVELMYSLETLTGLLGEARFADRLEMLAYNANPGTCSPDYWGHQYDQQANQVLCSVAKRAWSTNGDSSNVYGVEPNFGCCTANMHQGWPKLVSHLWMATLDRGLAAVAYGPSEVKAKVGPGADVVVTEETEYPFDGKISFTVHSTKPIEFPLYLRIPGWEEATVSVAGEKPATLQPGIFHKIVRSWKPGDRIELNLPMKLRVETRYNGAAAVMRGPLYFALKIGEEYRQIPKTEKGSFRFSQYPHADWEIHPLTPWNYGLILNREAPEKSITIHTRKVSGIPFAQSTAPVTLKVKGRAIPGWKLVDNSAGETPASPVITMEPIVDLELIPYGCTRLRITEFPTTQEH